MESNTRFYRRRLAEELAAAKRAVTPAAAERRMVLARSFAARLRDLAPPEMPLPEGTTAPARTRGWVLELE